eukprot:CAMPEP_0198260140 /NCGR_PEP_ID=MMETSP1447-20131203/9186_1 /TAXON_ID=420782 /ORGANISM="Chaetoceros dichaeta, Strain CCMP1751" /LENGTH=112 /DNA_ID=CAMNT_0043947727 /DNA_START=35 /DNA_END=370 /DNA_ORIENTATION=+
METYDYDETDDGTLVNISLYPSAQDAPTINTTITNVTIPMTSFAQLLTIQNAVRETGHVVVTEQRYQSTTTCSPDYGSLDPSAPPPPIDPTTTTNNSDPSNTPLSSISICAI